MRKLLLMLLCSVFAVNVALAQCSWTGWSGAADINPNGACNVDNARNVGSGTYTYVYMNAGWSYNFSTCGTAGFDNQLTIYDQNPAWTWRAYNDDNGPSCATNNSSINFTPTWTGWHIVINNRYNCQQHDFSGVSSTLRVRLTSVPAPTNGNMTLNGTAGNIVVCPGANIAVAQNGGNAQGGNYYYWIGTDNGSGWVNSWDYLNQGNANQATFNYSFANPGKYVIHTNATNVCGTGGPGVTRLVTVRDNNPGSITPATPSSMCQDGSASIQNTTAASSNGGGSATYYYYWQRTSAPVVGWTNYQTTTALSSALPATVTGTPGTYLLARNSDFGCGQANNGTTVNIPFTVYAKATVNAGADATICAGSAYTLSGSSFGGGASNATWSIVGVTGSVSNSAAQLSNTAATTTPATVTFTPNSGTAGTVTLRLTTNDPTGDCPAVSDDVVLTIVSQPTTANAGPDQTVCGTSVTLAGNAPSSGTGSWSIISGTGGSVTTPSSATSGFTGAAGNTYTLRWTISNSPCAASSDDVVITLRANPTTSNAGADQSVCATSATLAGNAPGVGTGAWSIISGTGGSFTNAALNNTAFSGTANTSYTLRWTISNSPCAASTDDVIINLRSNPTTSAAGADQTICGTGATLAGNTPTSGSGTWSVITGAGGAITTPGSPTSPFTGTAGTNYTLRWTIANAPCTASTDDVVISLKANPTTSNAGADQSVCATSATLAANAPTVGTGAWSVVSGTGGSFVNAASNGTVFNGTANTSYTLRWTISNAPCTASTDDVIINLSSAPTTANAGSDITICGNITTLGANAPTVGTGSWSIISGTGGTITTPSSPTSAFSGTAGATYTLRWTISNGACAASTDDVIVNFKQNPTTSNAGADQSVCATSATLAANAPTIGTGAWSVVSGTGGSFVNAAANGTVFNGTANTSYTLRWTISNAPCAASTDDVIIDLKANPTAANAGADISVCGTSTNLAGNTPTIGSGTWTIISGTGGSITTPSSPTSAFSGTAGGTYTLRWTIANAPCTASTDDVVVNFKQNPTTSNAGPDQTLCATSTTLAANTAAIGTGSWSIISGAGGTITSPSSPTSTFSGAAGTTYTLRWTISNAPCAASTDDVVITFTATPTTTNAGPDQTLCATSTTLAGNTPSVGVGTWSIISGAGGTITSPNSPTSTFSGTAGTSYTLRWTITNAPCTASSDDVVINFTGNPTTTNAGPDQDLCGTSTTLAGNTPVVGTGSWSIISGTGGTITTPTSPTSTFSGTAGVTYTLRWTISNAPCTASSDDVIIALKANPTTSAAGADQTVCGTSVTLAGNTPTVGTGSWSIISGTGGTITTPSSPTSAFSGTAGGTYTLRWTISNSPCTASTDDVVIQLKQNPTTSAAGADQTVCGTSVTLAANTPTIGTGSWSIISGAGGTITAPSSPASTFNGVAGVSYTLRWTISNAPCAASTDDVVINLVATPSTAAAGADQTLCASTTTLAANTPSVGTGAWSIISGAGGTVVTPSSPTSTFNGVAGTTYTLRWTISNAPCTASTDDVVINFTSNVTPANAGADKDVCGTSTTMAGNTPSVGTGTWTIISGTGGTITTPSSPTSTFSGVAGNTYTLRWTIANAPCASSSDDVIVVFKQNPTTAAAGADQTVCGVNATLAANTPTIGTGAWSIISGSGGSVTTPSSPTSAFIGIAGNSYTLRWTISNPSCAASTDDVVITLTPSPTTAAAGPDQTLCATSTTLAGNTPTIGTGTWSIVSGTGGTITTPSSPTSAFSGVAGTTYTLRWTIANAPCAASTDDVVISFAASVTTAAAGPDQSVCGSSATLAANTPAIGTGSWSIISGAGGTVTTPSSPTSAFTGTAGVSYTLRWTIANAPCSPSSDDVVITLVATPTTAAAGADQVVCGNTTTLAGNTPTVGTGSWSIIAGVGGSIPSPTSPTSSFSGTVGNTYTLRWTIANAPCAASTDDVNITLNPVPAVPTLTVTDPTCTTPSGTITVTAPLGAYTYNIDGGTYVATTSFSGLSSTTHTVNVKANVGGCTNTNTATVGPVPSPPPAPTATVTAQPTCVVPSGTIQVSSPVGLNYEYQLDAGAFQSSPIFTGVATGSHSVKVRLSAVPDCVTPMVGTLTVNAVPTPLATNPVSICQGGSGSLSVDAGSICIQNFVIPTIPGPNQIYGGWLAGDPTAATPSGAANTSTCGFTGAVRTYSAIPFQVSVTGDYVFEMNTNTSYNGAGYIVTGGFTPGSCATGTLIRADNASGSGGEPKLGSVGNPLTLTAGITYTLISTTDGGTDVVNNDFTWTVTPPGGGNVLINQPGTVEWYTSSSGGSPIGYGETFNPVGVPGSGLSNTNTQGTYTFWAACSSSPSCRSQADFVITSNVNIYNITPANTELCYDAVTPVVVGLDNSTNGLTYQLMRDGSPVGSPVVSSGGALTIGNTGAAGTYTVAVNSGSCNVPMNGVIEIKPVPVANAGSDVTLNCSSNVVLNATSNSTTIFTENFGTGVSTQLSSASSSWRIKYLYGLEPANRSEWWITYNGATPVANMANPVNNITSGSGLTMFDRRTYEPVVPGDYAWDAGTLDEIAYNTTPVDARLYTSVNLSFNYQVGGTYSGSNVYDYLQVMYSLDNGTTWVPISEGNNAGTFNLYRGMGSTNAFFANAPTTGTANFTMPAAVVGKRFLLGFRWVNDGDLNGAYVGGPMVDNINITGTASYNWSPTAGVTGSGTASPTITQGGTYTVVVTAGNGCTASDQVVVTAASVPNISISGNQDVCSGGSATLTAIVTGGTGAITNILWERSANNGGSWTTVQSSVSSVYNTNTSLGIGNYLYRASVTMSTNCSNTSSNVSVDVKADPAVTLEPVDVYLCSGGSATMTVAASGGAPNLLYEWEYDNGTIVSNSNPTGVTYSGQTTTDLTITTAANTPPVTIPLWAKVYAAGPGCDETYSLFANLNILADPTVSNPTPATQTGLCSGGTASAISITANGGTGAYSYQWYSNTTNSTSGGTLISGANSASYTPPVVSGTTYYYCVVGQAGSGCGPVTTAATASVTAGTPVVANVVVDECMNFAVGDKYYILVTGSGGTPPYTYPGAFYTSTTNQGIHELNAGASGTYTVTDAAGCSTTSGAVTAPTGRPNDIVMTSATGNITVDCWINNYNKWVTFRDAVTNNAIMAINDNQSNLGLVTVDVYKDAAPPVIYNNPLATNCTWTQHTAMRRHFKLSSTLAPTTGVDVMLFFSDDDYNALKADAWNNNTGYPNADYACTELDDVYNFNDLYVTKYTGNNEDGNYLNNSPSGLYRVYGDNTTPNRPLLKGEHTGNNTGFQGIYGGIQTHHYVQMTVTEFSEFWVHGSQQSQALPVEMIYLQADAMNNAYIRLSWATAVEVNNRGFEVERSTDGQNWTQIGFVDGHNNATVQHNYSYDDMTVAAGVVYYYRLKQVDYDNAFEYTDIVSARIAGEATFSVKEFIPNPTTDHTSLIVTGTKEQEISIAFYNIVGQKVLESNHVVNKGANTIGFDLARLASGTYTAVVSSANEVYTQKIVLAR